MPEQEFSPETLKRLRDAMQYSRRQLRSFQDKQMKFLRAYVGKQYGDYGSKEKMAINMLRMALGIYQRQLISRTPRILVLTDIPAAKSEAYDLEIAANEEFDRMDLGTVLQMWVKQAMFTMGIIKVGIEPYDHEDGLYDEATVQPYAQNVLFDDWVMDMTAHEPEQCDYMGNRYQRSLEDMRNDSRLNQDIVRKLSATEFQSDSERTSKLTGERQPVSDELYEKRDIWDVWLPREKVVLTISDNDESLQPLRVFEWKGPKKGMYHLLRFDTVPGNLMPVSPAMSIYDLSDLLNQLFRKVSSQALNQKTVGVVPGVAAADGTIQTLIEAADGDVVRGSESGLSVQELKMRGVDQSTFAMVMQVRELISYTGGNLDSLAGLQASAGTVGQEEILSQSASSMIGQMQGEVLKSSQNVLRDIARYMYTDSTARRNIIKSIPGTQIQVQSPWGPEERQAQWKTFKLDVEPYSLKSRGPGERLNTLMSVMSQLVLPAQQMLQAQGIAVDWQALLSTIARYSDMPELCDVISAGGAPLSKGPPLREGVDEGGGGKTYSSTVSPVKSSTNVRQNVTPNQGNMGGDSIAAMMSAANQGG